MASTLSKRTQVRNEKALQDLIRAVPGNDRCADCQARNPGWASWSLGIFLCMRCAALHRKLGTHISKVKSLSMDTWSNEQVENMKKIGNTNANLEWNPKNNKPPIPIDADEVDSAMERFIRLKYEQKTYTAGGSSARSPMPLTSTGGSLGRSYTSPMPPMNTGGTASSDDHPPPPPPKPSRRFGFGLRSASSAFPLGRSSHESGKKGASMPPITVGREPKVFGATIGVTESDKGLEWKLLQLKEMGFSDDKQNSSVLRGHNGDLEQAIASLIRLAEASGPGVVNTPVSSIPSRQNTPSLSDRPAPFGAGATISRTTQQSQQHTPLSTPSTARSNNPFEAKNPLASPAQSAFESAFANMSVSQVPAQQQTLFPNATGGHQISSAQAPNPIIQQSMTPPIPQLPQSATFNNPYIQMQQSYNPFISAQQPMSPPHSANNPYTSPQQGMMSPNPFLNQSNMENAMFSNSQSQYQLPQSQQQWLQTPQSAQLPHEQQWIPSPQSAQFQPYLQSPTHNFGTQPFSPTLQSPQFTPQSPIGQYHLNTYQQQMQPLMTQPTGRIDKSSIMALYNHPQLAATPLSSNATSSQNSTGPSPQPQAAVPQFGSKSPQRSVTMPIGPSRNPFTATGNASSIPTATQPNGVWHSQRESIESGRQSPDAFANLSARFAR